MVNLAFLGVFLRGCVFSFHLILCVVFWGGIDRCGAKEYLKIASSLTGVVFDLTQLGKESCAAPFKSADERFSLFFFGFCGIFSSWEGDVVVRGMRVGELLVSRKGNPGVEEKNENCTGGFR